MAIRNISQIRCSLNLGLIYSVSYEYNAQNGVEITIFFVNENGVYTRPIYLQKAQIQIGNASFSMNVVASDIQLSAGRRVIEVTFVDDTYKLDNYSVILTDKGCGFNVYPLGTSVDSRTLAQKQADALDPVAEQISSFTKFPDIEYTFDEFLAILRQKFNVQIMSPYSATITNTYTGTFRSVLESWCNFFNFAWFIENSVIKVFNPVSLTIRLPTQPPDAIEYSSAEDIRDTYGKTCYNWFQQEGGEFPLNQTSDKNGDLLVRTNTLYPAGYEFNLPQASIDLEQVVAAQYGQPFWFIYNYVNGKTATNCAWTPINPSDSYSVVRSVYAAANGNGRIAIVNETTMAQQFEVFSDYAAIAGRYYLSSRMNELAVDKEYTWFDESQGPMTSFTNVDDKAITLTYLTPVTEGINLIEGTYINPLFSGINYVGNRVVYKDESLSTQSYSLGSLQGLVNSAYQSLTSIPGSESMDFNSQLSSLYSGNNTYVAYNSAPTIPQEVITFCSTIPSMITGFQPRFSVVPIKGITKTDYATLKASQSSPDKVEIVNGNAGGTIVGNTAVIKTLKQGAYTVYYDKYSQCASAHATGPYFKHLFEPRQISPDTAIQFTFSKNSSNIYTINRDFATINALVNNPLLPSLAQPRTFPTKRVTFSVNYFYDVPTNFLTNGLVGLNVSIGDNGVTASYSYSNEVLAVPYPEDRFAQYEQQIRNSAIRHYTPVSVIT